ncbi:MAG: carbohydrate ABC transporter permease, partial [Firmicutes bacterium]|nr:carbohydrate ABC transporter permease [Bacillota bacterium]
MMKAKQIWVFAAYLLSFVVIIFVAFPFYWIVRSSFMGEADLFSKPVAWVARSATLDNYRYIFTGEIPTSYQVKGLIRSRISQEARFILPALKNSSIVAVFVTLINLLFGTPAAYVFARMKFRGSAKTFQFILMSRLLPPVAVAIPYYLMIKWVGRLDTHLGLILVYSAITLPFTVWYLTLYFRSIPVSMEEAGLVDGCTRLLVLRHVLVPLAAPGMTAAGAFAFMASYNEFLFGLLITQTMKSKTMPVLVAGISINPDVSYALLCVCIT